MRSDLLGFNLSSNALSSHCACLCVCPDGFEITVAMPHFFLVCYDDGTS